LSLKYYCEMKIGIIREGRIPPDKRVPFTPEQCCFIHKTFPDLEVVVQPSPVRCFTDKEYAEAGIKLQESLADCDVLMGIKKVTLHELIPHKTYFLFSHTVKKQIHNRELLREIIQKGIQLVDYELLTDLSGQRIIGFGRFAGLVGAYNALRAFGLRNNLFTIIPAWSCPSLAVMKEQISSVPLPEIRIAVTGGGRVGSGVMELLDELGIRRTEPDEFLQTGNPGEPVVVQLNPDDYNRHKAGMPFSLNHFFQCPEEYESNFRRFLPHTDLLISAAYWDPKAPVLFSLDDVRQPEFRISVIADITCDIGGSLPTTMKASTIENPFYDYNPETNAEEEPFSGEKNITVMAVDNLPCEIPMDSSNDFGNNLIEKVLPCLTGNDPDRIIERASISRNGSLTKKYAWLQDFIDGKE
jgi:saccharopine dehydrogenase (NAD+, L-lysine-forming)